MPAALAVIPFVLLLPTLISIPNRIEKFVIQDELIVNSSLFTQTLNDNDGGNVGPALFQRKLVGIAKPLYAELSEGVMSYHVKLFHEYNLQKVYYYIENSTQGADISLTTNPQLATIFVIQTGDKFYHKGGKFTIGYRSNTDYSSHLQLLGIREEYNGLLYLTTDSSSTNFKIAVGEITPYYMKDII